MEQKQMVLILEELRRLFPRNIVQVCKGFGIDPTNEKADIESYYYAFIDGFWFLPQPNKPNIQSFTDTIPTIKELDEYLMVNINNYKSIFDK